MRDAPNYIVIAFEFIRSGVSTAPPLALYLFWPCVGTTANLPFLAGSTANSLFINKLTTESDKQRITQGYVFSHVSCVGNGIFPNRMRQFSIVQ